MRFDPLPVALSAALLMAPLSALVSTWSQVPARDASARISRTGSGQLGGVVVTDGGRAPRPVRRATVTLTGTGIATFAQVITDDEGRFTFAGLPAGRFTLTAEKPAFVKTYYGSAKAGRPPGMPLALADGQAVVNLLVPLARGAAFSGRVTDQYGGPVASAQVQVQLVTFEQGVRRLRSPVAGLTQATTDDRGAYRIFGLPPGEYLVRAAGGGGFAAGGMVQVMTAEDFAAAGREMAGTGGRPLAVATAAAPRPSFTRVPSYYPGVADSASAQSLVLGPGEEREGIDIVSVLAPAVRVEGIAVGPDGQRLSNIAVGIANVSAGALYTSLGGVRADSDGRFATWPVTPGRWLFFGRAAEAGTPSDGVFPWWGQVEVAVGERDVAGVVLQFLPGATVSGQIVFQGGQVASDAPRLRLSLTPLPAIAGTGGSVRPVTPTADGTFVFESVPPGKYRLAVSAASNWWLRSATADDGRDTLDEPLEVVPGQSTVLTVTMTNEPTELSGVLLDQLGRPAPEYSVVVFSSDRAMWASPRRTSGLVRLGSDGTFRVRGLPPGSYLLCVVTDVEPALLNDPSFLEQLALGSVPVMLQAGETKVQNFKIGG